MAKSESVTCPLCGEIVKSGYLRAHKASAHGEAVSPANSIKRTVKNMSQTKQDGEVFVQCPDCPKKLKKKNADVTPEQISNCITVSPQRFQFCDPINTYPSHFCTIQD